METQLHLRGEVHHAEVCPVVEARIEDRDDAGVVEPRDELDLALEALPGGIGGHGGVAHDLERDAPACGALDGLIDHPHAADADEVDDVVPIDLWELIVLVGWFGHRVVPPGMVEATHVPSPIQPERRRSA